MPQCSDWVRGSRLTSRLTLSHHGSWLMIDELNHGVRRVKERKKPKRSGFKKEMGINQDGGVEGRALSPSCESTRITTGCWTIIDRKTLDFTKEDTPRARTEEKPQ